MHSFSVKMIYADNAATTNLSEKAFEAMLPWLKDNFANASQPYSYARPAKKALAQAREIIAGCINAMPEEIYFTSGGSESDNLAIKGSIFAAQKKGVPFNSLHIIASAIEHKAVLNACKAMELIGCHACYANPDKQGIITPQTFKAALSGETNLASIMLANNEIGTIQPIQELCRIAHERGAVFHSDAVQAIGHIPVNAKELGIDILSASAHKFHGPKGIGFIYVRKGTELSSIIDGGSQERGIRAGTENIAYIAGMAAALQECCQNIDKNAEHIKTLENILITMIKEAGIDFIRNGSVNRLPGIISLSLKGIDGEAILHRLDLMGICVSTGSACDSRDMQISHVIKAIKLSPEYAKGTVRISLCKNNTAAEVKKIAVALIKAAQK